jgi:hypothetical protein
MESSLAHYYSAAVFNSNSTESKNISVVSPWAVNQDFVVSFAAQNSPNEFSTRVGARDRVKALTSRPRDF